MFFCFATCLVGLSIGLMINIYVVGDALFPPTPLPSTSSTSNTAPPSNTPPSLNLASDEFTAAKTDDSGEPHYNQETLLWQAYAVLAALKEHNYTALSDLVHPDKGLTFTPYSTVDATKDRRLSADALSKSASNTDLYIWGLWDGSGLPIQLSIQDYFDRFVYNANFYSAPMFGVNMVLSSGNSQENVAAAYPEGEFIEFYFPGIEPNNNGFDWCGLKLVFERAEQGYQLVGLIHSEWTI